MIDKKEVNQKVDDIKSSASDKKDDVSDSISEMKENAMDKKDDLQEGIEQKVDDIKSGASDKKDDVSDSINAMNEDAMDKKDDLQDEAGKKRTQAEKLLNDIMNTIKVKQVEVGKTLSDYTTALQKPPADIIETNDSIIIKIDLPGVAKEDIDIGIAGESIDIIAKFEEESDAEDINYIQKERSYGETKRIIKLPSEIKVKEASAKFKDSVLTINLPKIEKEVHKININ
ncbi:MAG: Hsp20 family protein [Methanobacterium sp.]